jgi:cyclohexyl-isocyanide hydratase
LIRELRSDAMTQDRRDFLRVVGAAGAGLVASAGAAAAADAPTASATQPTAKPVHDMSAFPPSWTGKEQIAMLLYPGFTALDLVGPQYMLASLMGAKVHLVAATMAPVMSDTGMAIVPTATLATCPEDLDVLFVPGGGQGTLDAMRNTTLVRWVAERGRRARLVASVCTGSLVLGQAGLLRGKKATSHWVTLDLLREFGATPVNQRYVWDGALVTGAGVSAGIDLGLSIVGRLRDTEYAQGMQLLAEYAPQPPYDAGTPDKAPPAIKAMIFGMFDGLRDEMKATSRSALRS